MDLWIVKETCLDKNYEQYCTQIHDGWNVIDVGAGIGDFTVVAAKATPHGHVYAYEPFLESFELLRHNLELNDVFNVRAFRKAVGSSSRKMRLSIAGYEVQYSTNNVSSVFEEVDGISLSDILNENQLEHCDFLKMDCEGCEFDVLLNTPAAVLEKIERICLEYHDGVTNFSHKDLVEYLSKLEFGVETHPNPAHSYLGFLYAFRPRR